MLQGQGIKPWTHKKIMLQGQGIEPWTHKKDRMQGQGFKPWTDQKDRSSIVHAIAKYDRTHDCKISPAYEMRADA